VAEHDVGGAGGGLAALRSTSVPYGRSFETSSISG
jgi:hypothetical protein